MTDFDRRDFHASQVKLGEAEELLRRGLAGFAKEFGDAHVDTLKAMSNLAALLAGMTKMKEAEVEIPTTAIGRSPPPPPVLSTVPRPLENF